MFSMDPREPKSGVERAAFIEERSRLVAEGASVGIWDWVDVSQSTAIWSPRFYELLGYKPNEIEGSLETFKEILHPDDLERNFALIQKVFDSGSIFEVEYRLRTKSGDYRWFRCRAALSRHADGRPKRLVGSIEDIHGRRLADQALKEKSKELERSNRELEEFASIASHDLQEPLRTMIGFAQLIPAEKLDKQTKESVAHILKAAKRMQNLIADLLKYSRVAHSVRQQKRVSSREILAEAIKNLGASIQESGVQMSVPDASIDLLGDPNQLVQLFQNLISNAIKFKSLAKSAFVKISLKEFKGFAEFCVEDNGIGIASEFFDRIFLMFQRLHTADEYPGSGVGLALVKKIVESHGGQIRVESKLGEGSRFFFTLKTA